VRVAARVASSGPAEVLWTLDTSFVSARLPAGWRWISAVMALPAWRGRLSRGNQPL
jgi:hypothetical protein